MFKTRPLNQTNGVLFDFMAMNLKPMFYCLWWNKENHFHFMRPFTICDADGAIAMGQGSGLDAMVVKALWMWWWLMWGLGARVCEC